MRPVFALKVWHLGFRLLALGVASSLVVSIQLWTTNAFASSPSPDSHACRPSSISQRCRVRSVVARAAENPFKKSEDLLLSWEKSDKAQKKKGGAPGGLVPAGKIPGVNVLREATKEMAVGLNTLSLRIMANDGKTALATMTKWRAGLKLPNQVIMEVDVASVNADNTPTDRHIVLACGPVFLRYEFSPDSAKGKGHETAYIKPYAGRNRGVLFIPEHSDGKMRAYGDLPLALFDN